MSNLSSPEKQSTMPVIITISHQFGSGAAEIGQQLSEALGFQYLDRELIVRAAQKLGVLEDALLSRDERTASTFETFLRAYSFTESLYIETESTSIDLLSDEEIFKAESDIIEGISKDRSSVILGRCASFILRKHPRHISLYLHGDINDRAARTAERFNLSASEALKLVQTRDKDRLHYIQKFSKEDLYNANLYDLSFNTSRIKPAECVALILDYTKTRYK